MKELIHVIVDIIRKNATVDWEKEKMLELNYV